MIGGGGGYNPSPSSRLISSWRILFLALGIVFRLAIAGPVTLSASEVVEQQITPLFGVSQRVLQAPESCASAVFINNVNTTGWGELTVEARLNCTAEDASYSMGYLEGKLTQSLIWDAFLNFNASNAYLENGFLPQDVQSFVNTQTMWLQDQVNSDYNKDPYWRNVNLLLLQSLGVQDGYVQSAPPSQSLTNDQVYILTYAGDLEDVVPGVPHINKTMSVSSKFSTANKEDWRMDCSGFVKITPNFDDLFTGHNTWNSYYAALRIFKHYILPKDMAAGLSIVASTVSFSSRPGDLESKDDFYTLSSQLTVLETSLTVFNKSLYAALTPKSVPVWIRVQLANRMANSAPSWVSFFLKNSSGTHNSEWIVTDYNKFTPLSPLPRNSIWMVDEMVSYSHAEDMTEKFLNDGYLATFNIPYFQDIFNISGYGTAGFNYTNDSRYKLFKRDHVKAMDLVSMCALMNSNDYIHDPLSGGNPCNQISARCDLPGSNGTSHNPYDFGAIDSKNVNAQLVKEQAIEIIGGMPHTHVPVFSFDGQWAKIPHAGMPHTFDFDWTITYPKSEP
eukprot:m.30036 g.30036  ORF g.30036 m.30036 type:complete len:561 (-) comp6198_c0_seq1:242-1924(-)